MFSKVFSADICGVDAYPICVEADVSGGLPSFNMVGLLSSEIREARDRVIRAITNSQIDIPPRRVTINLSPASLRKQGSGFDLPIAVALLSALGIINMEKTEGRLFIGELSLDGSINKVNGVLPICMMARQQGFKSVIVPKDNAFEGSVVNGLEVYSAGTLSELIESLNKDSLNPVSKIDLGPVLDRAYTESSLDYGLVKGQEKAKRATMVAVAGFHNLLYIGAPGSGKSMMARCIPTILNRMSVEECLEVSRIYSVIGKLKDNSMVLHRPFRAPHHTTTDTALIGGGSNPRPGEITLAHKGVLFLDEVGEFKRDVIESLRIPIEQKSIVISRVSRQARMPADCMLVLATNPCKCGFYPDRRLCRCTDADVAHYMSKIKGPIMDRIDICAGTARVEASRLSEEMDGMTSEYMRGRIAAAQSIQRERFRDVGISYNSQIRQEDIDIFCPLKDPLKDLLNKAYKKFNMTARGYYKVLKVARTIADLEESRDIQKNHLLEAISYRNIY
ncbi:MAG: YifB family Mg chelatase-like AAA ATPase [Lachnospiraceae bacterium]|nr:YifB family Mg chelatase-like AAA ATPase [Lachnospiraceae bacterium]